MKTAKRKFYQTVLILWLIVMQCTMSVHADGLTQSEETVTATLSHEHTQDVCWKQIWVPCGGSWSSYFEPYVGATVYTCSNERSTAYSNGVMLSSIHYGWIYNEHKGVHSGEYSNRRVCEQSVAGTFTITKVLPEAEETQEEESAETKSTAASPAENPAAELVASVTGQEAGVSDTSFYWRCPDQSVVDGDRITISQNGVYRATLNWTDAKTGVSRTTTLDYVEISNPVLLIFRSGDKTIDEIEVSYGDTLPDIEIPVREGYDFLGYYAGDLTEEESDEEGNGDEEEGGTDGAGTDKEETGGEAAAWYDENGEPDKSITITGSALEETLTAKWKARSYRVHYGEDQDGDGKGDYEFYVTYGKEYDPIEVDGEKRAGYIFDGYYLGDEQVFDADGVATGVWRWDGAEEIILEPVYHKKTASSSGSGGHDDGGQENRGIVPLATGVISGNSVSENSISENSVSENSISENGISGDDLTGGHAESGREHAGGSGNGSYSGIDRDGNGRAFHDSAILDVGREDSGTSLEESGAAQEMTAHRISENMAPGKVTDTGVLKNDSMMVRAIEVTGITAGVLGLAYLIGWLFITKASLVELFSIRADESRRRLGAALILHGENAFHIRIKDKTLEQGETGRYQVVFRKRFALKHANQDIIIHCRKKEISEVIKPDIIFTE